MADYAVTLTTLMAREQHGLQTVTALAQKSGLTQSTVSQIVKKLAKAGVLNSARGASGGYTLALPADQTTMQHVVEAMEGPIALTRCLEHGGNAACAIEQFCCTKSSWAKVNDAVKHALGTLTLAEVAGTSNNKKVVNIK